MEIKKYPLQQHGDSRGHLVAVQEKTDVPFEIKRVYH
ncbi:MAG: WxcM-like domain-containing protein, partial [Lachnospiraceae bacterium]|nr:WxcM-like domain-containing protein [Lachnospiraceae bacterium]